MIYGIAVPGGKEIKAFAGMPTDNFCVIGRFHVEELQTGNVSLTIHNPVTEEDVAAELVKNGPPVPDAVDRLISEFFERLL